MEEAMDIEPLVFVGIDWAELPKVPTAQPVERQRRGAQNTKSA
jgi:hypothetical protein